MPSCDGSADARRLKYRTYAVAKGRWPILCDYGPKSTAAARFHTVTAC